MSQIVMFGSDPEFFIGSKYEENELIPPAYFRILNGVSYYFDTNDINKRHPIFFKKDDVTIHEDGAALEMTIPPSTNIDDLFSSIEHGLSFAEKVFDVYPEYGKISPIPAMEYNYEFYNTFGEEMILANRAGCDPDRDIDNNNKNESLDMTEHPWRYAGGHLHISTNNPDTVALISENDGFNLFTSDLIALFSTTVGLANIAFSKYPDLEVIRQFRFGKPGKWRYQVYAGGFVGVEYRTPSNSWITNWSLGKNLFLLMGTCLEIAFDRKKKERLLKYREEARRTILSGDQVKARDLFSIVEKEL